jgi:predicted metal-binding membrane protein
MNQFSASRLKRLAWRYPQWWLFPISLCAWIAIGLHTFSTGTEMDSAHRHHHGTSSMTMSWTSEYCWMLMVAAMMLPLISDSVRNVAARSLWSRRQRAIVGCLLGYLSVWLAAGIVISLLLTFLRSEVWFDPRAAMTVSFILAVAWHAIPIKKRALIACHRTRPIAPEGMQANLDCLRYGTMIGGSCLLNCWAWMLFCTVAGHHPAVMAFALFVGIAERYPIRRLVGTMLPSSTSTLSASSR